MTLVHYPEEEFDRMATGNFGEGTVASQPHCNGFIIHRPGLCPYCDMHPGAQTERIQHGVNFTGEKDPLKDPCPAPGWGWIGPYYRLPIDPPKTWH